MRAIVIASLVATLTPLVAAAQPGPCGHSSGSGGWGNAGHWGRIYDPGNVITLDGTVNAIEEFVPPRGMSNGMHLVLATKDAKRTILLGPSWYIEHQDTDLAVGDAVQVVGSRQTLDGQEVVIAKTVMKGNQLLRLRDDDGVPLWAGCRARWGEAPAKGAAR